MGKPKSHEEQGLQTWPRVGSGRVGVGKLLPLPGNKLHAQNRADMTKWWVSILQWDSTRRKRRYWSYALKRHHVDGLMMAIGESLYSVRLFVEHGGYENLGNRRLTSAMNLQIRNKVKHARKVFSFFVSFLVLGHWSLAEKKDQSGGDKCF